MTDKRKILVLDRKSFLLLRKRDNLPINRDRITNSIKNTAKLQIFKTMNLTVVSDKEVMKFAIWQWKRAFIRNEERIHV